MTDFLILAGVVILFLVILVLYRGVFGPSIVDRMIAINVVGTKTIALLLFMGFIFGRIEMFIDISIAYALINFIGTVAFAKYFERRGVF